MMGGSIMSVFGAVNSAIGSFYAADSQKTQLKMQAQNQRFQAQMSAINARGAEMQAQQSLLAGERAIGQYTMGAGQRRASATASMAARGIQGGVGSAEHAQAPLTLRRAEGLKFWNLGERYLTTSATRAQASA
jgi:hypothetical protein